MTEITPEKMRRGKNNILLRLSPVTGGVCRAGRNLPKAIRTLAEAFAVIAGRDHIRRFERETPVTKRGLFFAKNYSWAGLCLMENLGIVKVNFK